MTHQTQTQQLTEQLIEEKLTPQSVPIEPLQSVPLLKSISRNRVVSCTVAIATLLSALGSGLSPARAIPTPEPSFQTSAADLSETVLVPAVLIPEMTDADIPVLSQTLAQTSPEATSEDGSDEEYRFGHRGDDRWYVNAGAATTLDDDRARRLGLVGAGLSHFFLNGHSINLELNGMAFDQTGDDAVGLNLNAMLRWHLYRADNWSVYVDGGAGLLGTTEDVPAAGSQLNFTPQVGAGATIRVKDEERLMVGLRWHHISNADLYPPNPGRDSLYGYVGWNFPR